MRGNIVMTSLRSGLVGQLVLCAFAVTLSTARAGAQAPPPPAPMLEQELATEVDRFVEADRVAPPASCQVLFVGSSSIVKWKETLAADMAPMPVVNRGFGGSHIAHVNRWFNQIVVRYRPRAIVFYAGENDIDAGKSVEGVVADFDEFMARKTQALGKTPVYFISLKPSKSRFAQISSSKAGQRCDSCPRRQTLRFALHRRGLTHARKRQTQRHIRLRQPAYGFAGLRDLDPGRKGGAVAQHRG
jgi:hypothetical protein